MKKLLIAGVMMMAAAAHSEGGNIGSSGKSTIQLRLWCESIIGDLDYLKDQVGIDFSKKQNPEQRAFELEQGLIDALRSGDFDTEYSLIKMSIERGLEILESLKESHVLEAKDAYFYLRDYYTHLITEVAPLDAGYIEYRNALPKRSERHLYRCRVPDSRGGWTDCSENLLTQWEERFNKFAVLQLNWLLKTFATEVVFNGNRETTSIGYPDYYLRPAALIAGYAAKDLEESLWSDSYQCASRKLKRVADGLTRYNNGGGGFGDDDRTAINYTANLFKETLDSLDTRCGQRPRKKLPGNP